jgi:hypothetical protein
MTMNTPTPTKAPKARSPRYPIVGLKSAIERVRLVYEKDYQNKIQTLDAAKHMGFTTLNGKALGVLSALRKYGLLEGSDGSVRVSDLALKIIAHEDGDSERAVAIAEAAKGPELFAAIEKKWPGGKVSDQALRSYLLTEKFLPDAADTAIRSYRETKELVATDAAEHSPAASELESVASSKGDLGRKPESSTDKKTPQVEVGDLVQREKDGVLTFPKPLRVRKVIEDQGQKWFFVDGSESGFLVKEATIETKGAAGQPSVTLSPPLDPLPAEWREERLLDEKGEEIFVRYKGDPSKERYEFIRDYLDFKLKRMK